MRHHRLAAGFALALALSASAAWAQRGPDAATHAFGRSRAIEGQYIVVFKADVSDPAALAAQLVRQHGGQALYTYAHAIKGFAARLPAAAVEALRSNPNVDTVEQDMTVSLNETAQLQQQASASWGLDRVDQPLVVVDGVYHYRYMAAGVHAFVIDTGIRSTHVEFGNRVQGGYTAVNDGRGTTDCNGHGTHVAGTIGGASYGVAKAVRLVPVRVLDCNGSGSYSGVIAGVDWVAGSTLRPAVANMSLGGGFSSSVNASVAGAVAKGVTMVVAAGNSNADACGYSPSSEPTAITVGATTRGTSEATGDPRASYSNYGTCVDLFAPGSSIISAWNTSDTATNTISGTSMATPHVAGIAALALAANGSATPQSVTDFLIANATPNTIAGAGAGSPNRMAYSMADGAPGGSLTRTVAVSGITGTASRSGSNWRASATVTVKQVVDSNWGGAIAGATVTGTFSPGGSASCVTGNTGSCTLKSGTINRAYASTNFGVTNVTGTQLDYDANRNQATSITVQRPF